MSNVPGLPTTALPGVYSRVLSQSAGVSAPVAGRVAAFIGLGSRTETIVAAAVGGGTDGLNPNYTSVSGADGRHFTLSLAPVVSNRTMLFKNGITLVGLESAISTTTTFSDAYDYRIDINTGHIELQTAHLVNQGGSFYTTAATNVGQGTLQNLTLTDINAPSETWTIKCISVQRNNLNQPIAGTANFTAFGSVSGNVLDANGNPVVWVANNTVATNNILSFSILETMSGGSTISPFTPGDYFTVQVSSGVLAKNDTLTATYIAVSDINDPVFFDNMKDINTKHGLVSLDNTLSLGAFLSFAQTPPGILALQAAPSLPRRTSFELVSNFPATSTNCEDFQIPLDLGVTPDVNSNIHFFITNPATGVETQILPNKFPFFTLGTPDQPTVCNFVQDNTAAPGGNSYAYSVVQEAASINFAQDGYLNRDLTTQINAGFSSASVTLDNTYVGKTLNIIDATNNANIGSFPITTVTDGVAGIVANGTPPFADFINDTSVSFELIDSIFGLPVSGSSGVDGSLIAVGSTATGTFHSTAVNFSTFNPVTNHYRLKITSSAHLTDIGLFDITGYNSGTNTLTIAKSFVSESNLKFEIIDTTQMSSYLVVNHNIIPNGYSLRVTLVDERDAGFFDAGWELALATLETIECDIVVPLPQQTISAIFQNAKEHCLTMSNVQNRKERVLLIGAINGLTPDNVIGNTLAAVESLGVLEGIHGDTVAEVLAGDTEDLANYSVSAAYGDTYRVQYFYPDQIVVQIGSDNQIIDGFYLAAAAAGFYTANTNVAVPLTNKTLSGFTILRNRQFSPTVLQNLAAAGIAVLQPVSGGGTVIWGKSTAISGFIEEVEMSIVFIRDRLAKSFRQGLKGFIGNPEDPSIIGTITARAKSMLDGFVSQGLITDWTNLTVKQDLVDPTQINITVIVSPTIPLNTVYVEIDVVV